MFGTGARGVGVTAEPGLARPRLEAPPLQLWRSHAWPVASRSGTLDCVHTVHNTVRMSVAYVSGRVPVRYERLVARQARAARTSKSDLVARYVIEKSLESEFPGIAFRDSLSGREAYLAGHRVAVWEILAVHAELKSMDETAAYFRWPRVLVARALAYAKAFPEEIRGSREGETDSGQAAG